MVIKTQAPDEILKKFAKIKEAPLYSLSRAKITINEVIPDKKWVIYCSEYGEKSWYLTQTIKTDARGIVKTINGVSFTKTKSDHYISTTKQNGSSWYSALYDIDKAIACIEEHEQKEAAFRRERKLVDLCRDVQKLNPHDDTELILALLNILKEEKMSTTKMSTKQVKFNGIYNMGWNVGPNQNWTCYQVRWDYEQLRHCQDLFGHDANIGRLYSLLDLFGVGSTLTIGSVSGRLLAPEHPLTLTYPSGEPMEDSWQYLWESTEVSRDLVEDDINVYVRHPERFFEFATTIFKPGVALKATGYGMDAVQVTQIPMWRLPGMVKTDLRWQLTEKTEG